MLSLKNPLNVVNLCLLLFSLLMTAVPLQAQFGSPQLIYNAGFGEIPERVAAADLDGDGDIDILTKEMFHNPIFWMKNDGNGNFTDSGIELDQSNRSDLRNLITLDYDKDGDQDVIAVFADWQSSNSFIFLWENAGNGSFSTRELLGQDFEHVESLYATDYDHDNDQDILIGYSTTEAPEWLQNNFPAKSWTITAFSDISLSGTQYRVADIDNNSTADLITLRQGTNSIRINGQPINTGVFIGWPKFLEVVDIDGDTDPDIIAGSQSYDDGIVLIRNNGNGQFSASILENTEDKEINAIAMLDYDSDGDLDLFAGCWIGCGLSLYENIGAGTFTFKSIIGAGAIEKYELLKEDLDQDGRQDLVRNNASSHTVLWHRNTTVPFNGIEAGFIYTGSCFKEDILFEHAVRGRNIASMSWDFGDGQTSAAFNPAHRYAIPGTYEVTLTATNTTGQSDTTRKTILVNANPLLPDIDLKYCTSNLVETKTVTLDTAYTYQWFFSSSGTTPFHTGNTYTGAVGNGTQFYVIATSASGCESEPFKVTAHLSKFPAPPYATGNTSYNGPDDVTLAVESTEEDVTIQWFVDDNSLPFYTGTSLRRRFNSSTTLYVNTVNAGGCESNKVPVTASIFPAPVLAPSYLWADLLETETTTEGRDMTRDNDGNFVVMGSWSDGDIKTGPFTLTAGPWFSNRFIATYDKNGVVQNAFKLLSAKTNWLEYNEILVDHENNFYFTADVMGESIVVGDQTISLPADDVQRTVIIKTDAAGVLLWYKLYPYSVRSSRMVIDHNNEVVLHGVFEHTVTIEDTTLTAADFSGFIGKLHEDGSLSWIQEFPFIRDADLAIDNDNNIYIGGNMQDDTLDFGVMTVTKNEKAFGTAVVIKYSPDGDFITARDVLETSSDGTVRRIDVDSNNDLIIYGDFSGTTTLAGNRMTGTFEIYLMKCDDSLQLKWVRQFVGNGQEIPWELALDKDDNIYVTGAYWDKLSVMGVSFAAFTPKLHYQFATKISPDGIVQWARDADLERFASCEPDDEGGLFISGTFRKMTMLDQLEFTTATNLGNSIVNSNIFTTKLGFSFNSNFETSGSTCADTEIRFQDWSTINYGEPIVSWSWNFGDGTTSQQQHPFHTYSTIGTYTVTLDVMNNLAQTKTFTRQLEITVVSPPSITHSGNTSICSGGDISLSGPAGFASYWWGDGSTDPIRTITQAGDYQLKVGNALGCWSPYSEAVSIKVNFPPPPVTILSPDDLGICPGDTLELAAPEGYLAYEWNDGTTTRVLTINSAGDFKVRVANQPDCWSSFSPIVNTTMNAVPEPVLITASQAAPVLCPGDSVQLTAPSGHQAYEWSDGTTTPDRMIDTAGDYTVKVSNEQGCWSSLSNTISITQVEAPAPVALSPSQLVLCPGTNSDLVAPDGYASYVWNTGDSLRSIVVSNEGHYAVKVTNGDGCWSDFSESIDVSIAVPETPTISPLSPDKLSASQGVMFSWFIDDVDMNLHTQEIEITKSGIYTVKVTDDNGCASLSAEYTLIITGISKEPERSDIIAYPNPIRDNLFIANGKSSILKLVLINQLGQNLLTLPGSSREIDFTGFPDGAYLVAVQTTDGMVILKVNKVGQR